MPAAPAFSFAAVILAAGHSSRMGCPKMLLPWGDTTVLGHLIARWRQLDAAQIAVVCQESDKGIHAELDRLQFPPASRIVNPAPDLGMFSSIQCAARWNGWKPGLASWAVVLGDQPHLSLATLAGLTGFAAAHPGKICQPGRAGHGRHPVLLPDASFKSLPGSTDQTLKQFLAVHVSDIELIELNDPALELDIDRPEDFEKAREMFAGGRRE